jgi:hypothetical protein
MIDELALIGTRKLTDRAMSPPGPFRTSSDVRSMVAIRVKADIERLDPETVPRRRTLR